MITMNRAMRTVPAAAVATTAASFACNAMRVRAGADVASSSQLTPPTIDHAEPVHRASAPR